MTTITTTPIPEFIPDSKSDDCSSSTSSMSTWNSSRPGREGRADDEESQQRNALQRLSLFELQKILSLREVDSSSLVEKEELVQKIIDTTPQEGADETTTEERKSVSTPKKTLKKEKPKAESSERTTERKSVSTLKTKKKEALKARTSGLSRRRVSTTPSTKKKTSYPALPKDTNETKKKKTKKSASRSNSEALDDQLQSSTSSLTPTTPTSTRDSWPKRKDSLKTPTSAGSGLRRRRSVHEVNLKSPLTPKIRQEEALDASLVADDELQTVTPDGSKARESLQSVSELDPLDEGYPAAPPSDDDDNEEQDDNDNDKNNKINHDSNSDNDKSDTDDNNTSRETTKEKVAKKNISTSTKSAADEGDAGAETSESDAAPKRESKARTPGRSSSGITPRKSKSGGIRRRQSVKVAATPTKPKITYPAAPKAYDDDDVEDKEITTEDNTSAAIVALDDDDQAVAEKSTSMSKKPSSESTAVSQKANDDFWKNVKKKKVKKKVIKGSKSDDGGKKVKKKVIKRSKSDDEGNAETSGDDTQDNPAATIVPTNFNAVPDNFNKQPDEPRAINVKKKKSKKKVVERSKPDDTGNDETAGESGRGGVDAQNDLAITGVLAKLNAVLDEVDDEKEDEPNAIVDDRTAFSDGANSSNNDHETIGFKKHNDGLSNSNNVENHDVVLASTDNEIYEPAVGFVSDDNGIFDSNNNNFNVDQGIMCVYDDNQVIEDPDEEFYDVPEWTEGKGSSPRSSPVPTDERAKDMTTETQGENEASGQILELQNQVRSIQSEHENELKELAAQLKSARAHIDYHRQVAEDTRIQLKEAKNKEQNTTSQPKHQESQLALINNDDDEPAIQTVFGQDDKSICNNNNNRDVLGIKSFSGQKDVSPNPNNDNNDQQLVVFSGNADESENSDDEIEKRVIGVPDTLETDTSNNTEKRKYHPQEGTNTRNIVPVEDPYKGGSDNDNSRGKDRDENEQPNTAKMVRFNGKPDKSDADDDTSSHGTDEISIEPQPFIPPRVGKAAKSHDDDDDDYDVERGQGRPKPRTSIIEHTSVTFTMNDNSEYTFNRDQNRRNNRKRSNDRRNKMKIERLTRRRHCFIATICCLCCCLSVLVIMVLLLHFLVQDPALDEDRKFSDDPLAKELIGWKTTSMNRYLKSWENPCNMGGMPHPHVMNQCECNGYINVLASDISKLRNFLAQHFMPYLYPHNEEHYSFANTVSVTSCDPRNQALVLLSSGNLRDSGDITQRYIAALFYVVMNGPNWDLSSDPTNDWLSEENECLWMGIKCSRSSQIIRSISITDSNVAGQLPTEIALLTTLKELDLGSNQIVGSIPSELALLSNLRSLNLEDNQITAVIPNELGSWRSIEKIHLGGNSNMLMPSIPRLLLNFRTSIKEIRLNNMRNMTGTIPIEFTDFGNLTRLDLNGNRLSGTIMTEFGRLTNLEYLSLSRNEQITGSIPTVLGLLSNMKRLDLSYMNLIGTIPSQIGSMRDLEGLAFEGNQIHGFVAQDICDLRGNDLSYFTTDCLSTDRQSGVSCRIPVCCTGCKE